MKWLAILSSFSIFLLYLFGILACRTGHSCHEIFDGRIEYCLTDDYKGEYVHKLFPSDGRFYRVLDDQGKEEIEIEWYEKSSYYDPGSWDVHIQDLMKKSEDIKVLKMDTSRAKAVIELIFKDNDTYYLERSSVEERGYLTVRYTGQGTKECLKDLKRIYALVNNITAI